MLCIGCLKQRSIDVMLIAAATVPTFLTAVASSFGTVQQKGTVLGIFRSLGALARAFGPVVASFGMHIALLSCCEFNVIPHTAAGFITVFTPL